jgi:predicted dehydrogenase
VLPSDNFVATLKYKDGSVCNLSYTALGSSELEKEYIEIYSDGRTITIDDFKNLLIFGAKSKGVKSRVVQKGHLDELVEFARCLKGASGLPISMDQLISATTISFTVNDVVKGDKQA